MSDKVQGDTPEIINSMPSCQELARTAGATINHFSHAGLSVSQVTVQPAQIPSEQNGYTAVVRAGLHTSHGSFEGIGAVQPEDAGGSTHPQRLLDQATGQALFNASVLAKAVIPDQALPPNTHISSQETRGQMSEALSPPPKKKYHHSTTKPASESQKNLISTKCNRHGIDLQQALEQAGIPTDRPLTSYDANRVIQSLG